MKIFTVQWAYQLSKDGAKLFETLVGLLDSNQRVAQEQLEPRQTYVK